MWASGRSQLQRGFQDAPEFELHPVRQWLLGSHKNEPGLNETGRLREVYLPIPIHASSVSQRWAQYTPSHMLFCHLTLPLLIKKECQFLHPSG